MNTEKYYTKIQVHGMNCNNCAIGLKKHLEKKGFKNVNVNFSTAEASCNISNQNSIKTLEKAIQELGYSVIKESKKKPNLSKVEKILKDNSVHYDEIGEVTEKDIIIDKEPILHIDDLIKSNKNWLKEFMEN